MQLTVSKRIENPPDKTEIDNFVFKILLPRLGFDAAIHETSCDFDGDPLQVIFLTKRDAIIRTYLNFKYTVIVHSKE